MNSKLRNVAESLASPGARCYVNWRYEKRSGEEKPTKVPKLTSGNGNAKPNDPSTWSTLDEVIQAMSPFSGFGFDGIGIMFTKEKTLLGIDIDHCIQNGEVSSEIAAIIEKAQTYTEISPSNTGLHLWLKLTEPLTLERKRSGHFECYTEGRWFTITGNEWKASFPVRTVTPLEALEILRMMGYPWKKESGVERKTQTSDKTPLTDQQLLDRMFKAQNGAKVHFLYDGDTTSYGSHSEADAALCSHLAFWTGKNVTQMERLWLTSPLGARSKTQDREDYRRRTIDNAIANCTETYSEDSQDTSYKGWSSSASSEPLMRRFRDVIAKPIRWLWENRIALGKLTLYIGDPDGGKSVLSACLASIVSRGSPFPVDGTPSPIGDVVILSAEDDAEDTIKPRLEAAGADCSRVHILEAIRETGTDGKQTERTFSLKRDLKVLENVLSSLPQCKLVIIDPISAYLDDTDSHRNAAIRGLLSPLTKLAAKFGVAIVAIDHLNKNSNEKNAMYRPGGSLAFVAAARAAYIVARDKDNPERRIVAKLKNNLAKSEPKSGLAYTILTADNGAPILAWEPEPVDVRAAELLSRMESEEQRLDTDWAGDTLHDVLANGPVPALEVFKECDKAGVSKKQARRAAEKLGVITKKTGFQGGWTWELPSDSASHDSDTEVF